MHALRSWVGSLLGRRQRVRVSVGLDLGPDFASWVILSGSELCAASVVNAERLTLPEDWVAEGRITQPTAFGHWLRQALLKRGWAAHELSIGVDDAFIASHRLSLASGLTPDDVSFQLLAEVQSALVEGADVRIDYHLSPIQGAVTELTYDVQSVLSDLVSEAQQFSRSARLTLVSLMSRGEANRVAKLSEALGQPTGSHASAEANDSVALGLAMSAWRPVEFNFLPHREMAQQTERLRWLRLASTCCVAGACLAALMVLTLNAMTDTLLAKLPPSEIAAATRTHQAAKQAHDQLTGRAQRANAQTKWLLGQQELQNSTVAWLRLLGQPASGVWLSHITQKGAHWSVQGEALSSQDAQQWVQRWGGLDIWAKPPQLPAVQLTQSLSQQGVPVWQFQVDAELKEVR